MTSPAPGRALTVEEYLRLEEASPIRHEYVAGTMYAMAPVRARHHRIVSNVYLRVAAALRGRACEAFRESFMLRAGDAFYYPDVMVVRTPLDEDQSRVDDACLLVEVTSTSTAATDRREKLVNYKKLPSLRAYLIVDHRRRRVTHHWRDDDGAWWHATVTGDEPIALPCVDLALTLAEIYEGVQVPAVREQEPPAYDAEAEREDAREEAREEALADEELAEIERLGG